MAYEKLNLADGDTLKAEHLSHMEDGIKEANKVIVTEGGDTMTWDGNTEGLVNLADTFFKVSNAVPPTPDELANGATVMMSQSIGLPPEISFTEIGQGFSISTNSECVVIQESAVGIEIEGIIPQEPGVYLLNQGGVFVSSLTIPGYTGFAKEQVNPEYLPEHTHDWADVGESRVVFIDEVDAVMTEEGLSLPISESLPIPGETLTVEIDGVTYESVCVVVDIGVECQACGNLSLSGMGEDTGEPFVVVWMDFQKLMGVVVPGSIGGNVSVKVSGPAISKIPEQYISAVKKLYVTATGLNPSDPYLYHDITYEKKVTQKELKKMCAEQMIMLCFADLIYFYPGNVFPKSESGNALYGAVVTNDGAEYYTAEYTP